MKLTILLISCFTSAIIAVDLQRIQIEPKTTEEEVLPPPKPYAFGYAAGRYPGHIDRTHSEVSDGKGVVQGSYSYVDPRHQIRTVNYIADKNGFHPIINGGQQEQQAILPQDTDIVAKAKQRHLIQYANIANAHGVDGNGNVVVVPVDSIAVQKAKNRHYNLYQKIAEEHARIAAERGENEPNLLVQEH